MPKKSLSVTLPDGTTATRTTARTYSHVVCVELRYDGEVTWSPPEWCGRPDLADKAASRLSSRWLKRVGQDIPRKWTQEEGFTGYRTLLEVVVHKIPVIS